MIVETLGTGTIAGGDFIKKDTLWISREYNI